MTQVYISLAYCFRGPRLTHRVVPSRPEIQNALITMQALVADSNPHTRLAAAVSLDPSKAFRKPGFEEGVARYLKFHLQKLIHFEFWFDLA